MDPVKHATEVFGMVTAEVTSLKAQPDLDPLQKARVVAQLCAVAMQALALCHATTSTRTTGICARSSNRGYDCASAHRRRIIDLAARHGLPAIYGQDSFGREGGLMPFSSPMRKLSTISVVPFSTQALTVATDQSTSSLVAVRMGL